LSGRIPWLFSTFPGRRRGDVTRREAKQRLIATQSGRCWQVIAPATGRALRYLNRLIMSQPLNRHGRAAVELSPTHREESPMQSAMILGFPVHTMSCDESLDAAWRWLETDGPPRYMACANPYSLDLAIDDAAFASALREADLLVPDGVGMLIAGRILTGRRHGFFHRRSSRPAMRPITRR